MTGSSPPRSRPSQLCTDLPGNTKSHAQLMGFPVTVLHRHGVLLRGATRQPYACLKTTLLASQSLDVSKLHNPSSLSVLLFIVLHLAPSCHSPQNTPPHEIAPQSETHPCPAFVGFFLWTPKVDLTPDLSKPLNVQNLSQRPQLPCFFLLNITAASP